MSTKIYNGLVIHEEISLASLSRRCKTLRNIANEKAEKEMIFLCSKIVQILFEEACLGLESELDVEKSSDQVLSPASRMYDWLEHQKIKNNKGERNDLVCELDIVFFPMKEGSLKTLAIAYGPDSLTDLFKSSFKTKEYGYWDNEDKPDELSASDWKMRKREWERALGPQMELTPREAGISICMVSSKFKTWWTPEVSEIVSVLKEESFVAKRSDILAKKWVRQRLIKSTSYKTMSDFIREARINDKWLESEGADVTRKISELLHQGLPILSEEQIRLDEVTIKNNNISLAQAVEDLWVIETGVHMKNIKKNQSVPRI